MSRLSMPCPPDRHADFAPLEASLQYTFRDKALLSTALTHSSGANENGCDRHNERLEFLGDAVLEVHISQGLYERFPAEREGGMTRLRSRLVSEAKLAELARGLNLGLRAAGNDRLCWPMPWKRCWGRCIWTEGTTKRPAW